MKIKEYEMPDGSKAVFEYDEVGKITLECMDMLMGLINDRPQTDCNGCKFVGTYDTEFPCVNCSRKTKDYYTKTEPQTEQRWTCERCGCENHADFKWCFKCGYHKPERSE